MAEHAYIMTPRRESADLARLVRHLHACRTMEDIAGFNNATIGRRAALDVDGRSMLEAAVHGKADAVRVGAAAIR